MRHSIPAEFHYQLAGKRFAASTVFQVFSPAAVADPAAATLALLSPAAGAEISLGQISVFILVVTIWYESEMLLILFQDSNPEAAGTAV